MGEIFKSNVILSQIHVGKKIQELPIEVDITQNKQTKQPQGRVELSETPVSLFPLFETPLKLGWLSPGWTARCPSIYGVSIWTRRLFQSLTQREEPRTPAYLPGGSLQAPTSLSSLGGFPCVGKAGWRPCSGGWNQPHPSMGATWWFLTLAAHRPPKPGTQAQPAEPSKSGIPAGKKKAGSRDRVGDKEKET